MRKLAFWLALASCALAKPTLPVEITRDGEQVKVRFRKAAQHILVQVDGTGSVTMTSVKREAESLSAGQQLAVPLSYKVGDRNQLGGLAVQVRADFGAGPQSQWQSFDLVLPPNNSVRAKNGSGTSGSDVILVPSKTTIRP